MLFWIFLQNRGLCKSNLNFFLYLQCLVVALFGTAIAEPPSGYNYNRPSFGGSSGGGGGYSQGGSSGLSGGGSYQQVAPGPQSNEGQNLDQGLLEQIKQVLLSSESQSSSSGELELCLIIPMAPLCKSAPIRMCPTKRPQTYSSPGKQVLTLRNTPNGFLRDIRGNRIQHDPCELPSLSVAQPPKMCKSEDDPHVVIVHRMPPIAQRRASGSKVYLCIDMA